MWYNAQSQNDNKNEISFLEVKELYDTAYAEKTLSNVDLTRFSDLMHKADKLAHAYRAQLITNQQTRYKRAA